MIARRTRWRAAALVLLTLLLLAAGTLVWAQLSLDRSTVARTLVWRDADVYDIDRFPARAIAAGDHLRILPDCAGRLDPRTVDVSSEGATRRLDELLDATATRGFLVISDGCVLTETYGRGATRDTLLTSFSVAKSVLSTLVGIAVSRGDLPGIDEPVTRWLPELAERDRRFEEVTLRHLMGMASGLRYEEAGMPWSDDAETYYSPDLRRTALGAEVREAPGRTWLYNNFNPLLVGLVLERATGASVAAYAAEHLWAPMGAEADASWSLDSEESGLEKLESGFNATLRDWGRFALLVVDGGDVEGRTVVDPAWLAEATSDQGFVDDPSYGLWWWLSEDGSVTARGNKGQYLYVDAEAGVVVARFGEDYGIDDWPEVLSQVADHT